MATKVVSTSKETPNLVDSHKEAARDELESFCRSLIFSFTKMKHSEQASSYTVSGDPACVHIQHLLLPDVRSKPIETKRGTKKLNSGSSSDIDTDHSEGSSVDLVTDSSVDLAAMADRIQIRGSEDSIRGLVPATLPLDIRGNVSKTEEEDVKKLYDIDAGVQKVRENELSTAELIVLHLRSYRNIIKYEISDMETFRSRFVGYFGSILADIMERVYPGFAEGTTTMNEVLAQDFRENHRQATPSSVLHVGETPSSTSRIQATPSSTTVSNGSP